MRVRVRVRVHHAHVLALASELRARLVGELVARLLAELLHAKHALGVVLLAPLGTHALGELLAAAALRGRGGGN